MKNLDVVVRVKREPMLVELRPVAEALTTLIDEGLVDVLIVGGGTGDVRVPHVSEFMLVFSAHAEVVPSYPGHCGYRRRILRARGGSSISDWDIDLEGLYSPRTRR